MWIVIVDREATRHRRITRNSNYDLENICTPVDVKMLDDLLKKTNYPDEERQFLTQGFSEGFSLGYEGPLDRQDVSDNIPFTIGDKWGLWEKLMKDVGLGRLAGPYEKIPFKNYVQSPIGLVPKDGGKQTRLIFHLSYKFKNGNESINYWTLHEK